MNIPQLLERVKGLKNCNVFPPSGIPCVPEGVILPPDVIHFYEICGGIKLFKHMDYSVEFVKSTEFVPGSSLIWEEDVLKNFNDILEVAVASSWYRIVDLGGSNFITIDLNHKKSGLCYKAFWDSYAVAGETPIVANSFTELLSRLIDNNGEYWYFLQDDFVSYGDAFGNNIN